MIQINVTLVSVFPREFLKDTSSPSGMSILKTTSKNCIPWMLCLNRVFFLLGSLISVAIVMFHDFTSVSLLISFTYFTIILIGFKVKRLNVARS